MQFYVCLFRRDDPESLPEVLGRTTDPEVVALVRDAMVAELMAAAKDPESGNRVSEVAPCA